MNTDVFLNKEILIVEDEPLFAKRVSAYLRGQKASVTLSDSLEDAKEKIRKKDFDYALVDILLPDGKGLELLRENCFSPETGVVIMTADSDIQTAIDAMRLGAGDYLSKPFEFDALIIAFERCDVARQRSRAVEYTHSRESSEESGFYFGQSLTGLKENLHKILDTDRRLVTQLPPVLIEGETGTGKSTMARWLHYNGPRASQPLIEINCSALPDTIAESELFGHERGAFTDAKESRMGLFEAAHKGTLFLDEVASLSPAIQAKVLTAIEDRRVRRMGSNKTIYVDTRLIAASLQDLKQLTEKGQFRPDLYHRLNLLHLQIPPLRSRGEDIVQLAHLILKRLKKSYRIENISISSTGENNLKAYSWPGNVRELAHELERTLILGPEKQIDFEKLSSGSQGQETSSESASDWLNTNWDFPEEGISLEETIQRFIALALRKTGNNLSAAARLLNVKRDYLRYRLQK
jgi:two-component system response regulator AtoC